MCVRSFCVYCVRGSKGTTQGESLMINIGTSYIDDAIKPHYYFRFFSSFVRTILIPLQTFKILQAFSVSSLQRT